MKVGLMLSKPHGIQAIVVVRKTPNKKKLEEDEEEIIALLVVDQRLLAFNSEAKTHKRRRWPRPRPSERHMSNSPRIRVDMCGIHCRSNRRLMQRRAGQLGS
ncbi:hypothetical protein I3842_01G273900 [Carya illinoinensis]|uniref:Uncharacterized protein n=1 Tax=Carya illinoinensis TaxID=32201 RepID=A0A922GDV8_CARIL|nr:hypothetical protein I3842_01G273900 [Carya illinoinensis]